MSLLVTRNIFVFCPARNQADIMMTRIDNSVSRIIWYC